MPDPLRRHSHSPVIQPRFMVICGDLGNAFPHEDEYADQVAAVNAELLKVSLLSACP